MKAKHIAVFSVIAIILLGGSVALAYALLRSKPIEKQFSTAALHHIQEIVRTNGTVKPAQSVDLSFERGGRIARITKNVGDSVKVGDVLMELENSTEASVISQARALLDQRRAGFSATDIAIAQASVDAAKADEDKTKTDMQASLTAAQAAVDVAQNNLKLASGGDQSEIVGQAYESAVTSLQSAIPQLDNGLSQADSVLGIDHSSILPDARLSAMDQSKLALATNAYIDAKTRLQTTRDVIASLSTTSQHNAIDAAILNTQTTTAAFVKLLGNISDVLKATPTGSTFSQATLSATQLSIQQTRTSLTAQASQLVATSQSIENAKNSLNATVIAFNKATKDLRNVQASATSLIRLKEAAYQQALANLSSKTQPVRSVDLAPLQASLNAAGVAYSKTILKSPIDGIISRQDGKVGAIISPNLPIVSVINATSFQLETFIPETDLAKVKVGNTANVTTDAYGSSVVFPATVVTIDPNISSINGVTGYKVTLQFTQHDDRIKDGMTGNATIVTQEKDAPIALPEQALLQNNGTFEVLLQSADGHTTQQTVEVGALSSDGWREITSGINVGDHVEDFGN